MLFSDFLYRGAHHFQKQFVNAAGIPVFPEQGVPQPVQALDYEGGFLRRICDKVFLFLHLACLLCASIIYGGEDSRKCAIFRLGLSHEAPTILDFFGEIYSSAAKNLDFMRVCESVVMNIGTSMSVHNRFMLWTLILLFNFIRFVRGEQVLCLLTFCLKRISLWEYTPHLRPSECWLCSFRHLMTVVLSNRQNDNR